MMGLADDLEAALSAARKPQSFRQWIAGIDDEARLVLERYAADPGVSNTDMMTIVRRVGGTASKDTIADWRAEHGLAR